MALRHQLKERLLPLPGEEYQDHAGGVFVIKRVTDKAVFMEDGTMMFMDEWCRRRSTRRGMAEGDEFSLHRTKDHPASGYSA